MYVCVCFAVIRTYNIDRFDSEWFRTLHAIEGEIPTLAATNTATNLEISIILDLQCRILVFLHKDTILGCEIVKGIKEISIELHTE